MDGTFSFFPGGVGPADSYTGVHKQEKTVSARYRRFILDCVSVLSCSARRWFPVAYRKVLNVPYLSPLGTAFKIVFLS